MSGESYAADAAWLATKKEGEFSLPFKGRARVGMG
jgi:hypothetical protein